MTSMGYNPGLVVDEADDTDRLIVEQKPEPFDTNLLNQIRHSGIRLASHLGFGQLLLSIPMSDRLNRCRSCYISVRPGFEYGILVLPIYLDLWPDCW